MHSLVAQGELAFLREALNNPGESSSCTTGRDTTGRDTGRDTTGRDTGRVTTGLGTATGLLSPPLALQYL